MNEPKPELAQDAEVPPQGPEGQPAEAAEGGRQGVRRSKTMSRKEMARDLRRRRALGLIDPEEEELIKSVEGMRPKSRADCVNSPRPCLFVSCKHHLYLDVNPETGSIKLNFPDKEIWELEETCALDVADKGGITLEEVGAIMNLTRERIRQVETRGLLKLREAAEQELDPNDPNARAVGAK
jgi:hypothetical protein